AWSAESDLKRELQQLQRSNQDLQLEGQEPEEIWCGLKHLRKRVLVLGANLHLAGAEDLRRMVSAVEHSLKVQGEQMQQQLQELAAEECGLEQSLQASVARFDAWAEPATSSGRTRRKVSVKRPKSEASEESLRQRVQEVTKKLVPGTGGWCQADHDAFLRLLGRFRNRASAEFLQQAQELLPHLSHEHLVAHAKWLLEQDALRAEQQEMLQQWRALKPAKADAAAADAGALAREAEQEQLEQQAAQEAQRQQRAEKKRQVEAWRQQRAQEAALVAEKEAALTAEREKGEERRRKERERQKQEMDAWRQQKSQLKQSCAALQAPQTPPAVRLSDEERARLRARSESLAARRRAEREQRAHMARSASEVFQPPPREAYAHVPGRLESHTEQYVQRKKNLEAEEKFRGCRGVVPGNFAHQGLVRTLRAAPGWRAAAS
ncbi:unnamed protein product, partial [Effrenium voratum]